MWIRTKEEFFGVLDQIVAAHTTQDRLEIVANIKRSMEDPVMDEPEQALEAQSEVVVPADEHMREIETETVHYADGSSATGPAPLPDHSPEGAPAVAGHPENASE